MGMIAENKSQCNKIYNCRYNEILLDENKKHKLCNS